MSFKQALFLTIIAVLASTCYCSDERTETEVEEFRNFLLNLPNKDENEEKYPVIPGEISLLCTNCVDRMKRTVMVPPKRFFKPSSKLVQGEVRNRCPLGYIRHLKHLKHRKRAADPTPNPIQELWSPFSPQKYNAA